MPSLVNLIARLREQGYVAGSDIPDEATLIDILTRTGRNIEQWAPGELAEMARITTLVPMAKYRSWYRRLPREFREAVEKVWGPPERSTLMTVTGSDARKSFVVPGLRLGNLYLGPQPLRTTYDRAVQVQHDTLPPPPHSYIAAYLWYRYEFMADAVVHMGRHGTLEWLPGKHVGQAGWDDSEALLGDLPNPYYFIIDGGGEAIQARRRSAGVMIGHLTPLVVSAGAQAGTPGLEGTIEIEPGNRIPFIPAHTLKVYADLQATTALSIDVDVVGVSNSLARGNENGAHEPDGTYYLGPGVSPGHAVVDLSGRFRATSWLQIFAQLNNLLDRRYYSAAQLGPAAFTQAGAFIARPFPAVNGEFPVQQTTFFAPGAPRAVFVGTRLMF